MFHQWFPIHYPHPERTPIRLILAGDRLLIVCRLAFSSRALTSRPDGSSLTYAELVTEGIQRYWSGTYQLPTPEGVRPLTVTVEIRTAPAKPAVRVMIKRMLIMPAHVRSPLHRLYWGFFRYGHLETIGTNWSPEQPGHMVLPFLDDAGQVMRIAAHEAGHLFGLGDAYAAIYRFYDAAPGTAHYMMHSNLTVQPEEILMMLKAHVTRRMQFFPRSFNWHRFRNGFSAELNQRLKEVEARLERRAEKRKKPSNVPAGARQSVSNDNLKPDYNGTVTGPSVVSSPSPGDNDTESLS